MTLVRTTGQPHCIPAWDEAWAAETAMTISLGANTEKCAMIGHVWWPGADDSKDIRYLSVIIGTNTLAADVTFSVQAVSTAAQSQPSGTPLKYIVATFASGVPANGAEYTTARLTSDGSTPSDYTVARGALLAVVADVTAYTSGACTLTHRFQQTNGGHCYTARYTAAAWVGPIAAVPIVKLTFSDGTIGTFLGASYGIPGAEAYGNDDAPISRGNAFVFTAPCEVEGFRVSMTHGGVARDFNVSLSKAAVLQESVAFDGEQYSSASGVRVAEGAFTTRYVAAAGETWYLMVEPTTTANISLGITTVPAAGDTALLPAGTDVVYAYSTATGPITPLTTTTKRAGASLMISALDDGVSAGGGGGLVLPRGLV